MSFMPNRLLQVKANERVKPEMRGRLHASLALTVNVRQALWVIGFVYSRYNSGFLLFLLHKLSYILLGSPSCSLESTIMNDCNLCHTLCKIIRHNRSTCGGSWQPWSTYLWQTLELQKDFLTFVFSSDLVYLTVIMKGRLCRAPPDKLAHNFLNPVSYVFVNGSQNTCSTFKII